MASYASSYAVWIIRRILCFGLFWGLTMALAVADDGYGLWLNYSKVENEAMLTEYRQSIQYVDIVGNSPTTDLIRRELQTALPQLLGRMPIWDKKPARNSDRLIVRTVTNLSKDERAALGTSIDRLQTNGFLIKESTKSNALYLVGADELGTLYGTFHLLRLIQGQKSLRGIDETQNPRVQLRMLNHWDNLNRTVERGYAGLSIWQWDELPDRIDPRYADYARANASIGINAVAVNNVNASPQILTDEFLEKVAVLADVFRPYGIRVFISVNFASPRVLDGLDSADPLDKEVQAWWKNKTADLYKRIPDFGGFLVKANSEGQPGPQDYGRSHVDGANMLADALAPHGGMLIWRAFVYESNNKDRVKDPYDEFVQFDGDFLPNVMVQTKNGPLDFQPREPFSPLFGAMPRTPQMMEFQITQEYMGFSTHLVYLPMLYKEILDSDTYAKGASSTVAKVLDGTLQGQHLTGIAGVANIGDSNNWTGHPFGQANLYAFGRLAWDHSLSAAELAEEWIRMTLTQDAAAVNTIKKIMLHSYAHAVNYQTPLGLTVLSSIGHHYGPQPWRRANFHHANRKGLGYNRSSTGSKAVEQYFPPLRALFDDMETCPEEFLAWFHHVPWSHKMQSGRTFWEELCAAYYSGVEGIREMQHDWRSVADNIDPSLHQHVAQLLETQEDEAVWWRDACLWYFGQYAPTDIPSTYEKPRYTERDFKRKEYESRELKHYSTE